jgi:hypothetical protein
LCCDVTVAQINYPGKGTSKLIKLAKNIISKHLIVVVCVRREINQKVDLACVVQQNLSQACPEKGNAKVLEICSIRDHSQ